MSTSGRIQDYESNSSEFDILIEQDRVHSCGNFLHLFPKARGNTVQQINDVVMASNFLAPGNNRASPRRRFDDCEVSVRARQCLREIT